MKGAAGFLLLFLLFGTPAAQAFPLGGAGVSINGFGNAHKITIDHTKVGAINNTDQTNFSVLISGTYTYLRTVGNGGYVNNTVSYNGQTVPADVIFTSDAGCSSPLSWEIASYTDTTGAVEAWVKEPTLSHSVDPVLYMCVGKSSVSAYQGGAVGAAWNATYKAVYHLANGSTLSLLDSTANGNTLTNVNTVTAGTGKIDGGATLNGTSQVLTNANGIVSGPLTMCAWLNASSGAVAMQTLTSASGGGFWDGWYLSGGTNWTFNVAFANTFSAATGAAVTNGTPQFVCGVVASSTSRILYVNGVQSATDTANMTPAFATRALGLGASVRQGSTDNFWGGIGDEGEYSTGVLSADWINTEYLNQLSPSAFYTIN